MVVLLVVCCLHLKKHIAFFRVAVLLAPSQGQLLCLQQSVALVQQANMPFLEVEAQWMTVGSETTLLQHCFQQGGLPPCGWMQSLWPHSLCLVPSCLIPARAPCLAVPAPQCHSSCLNLHLSLSCFANARRSRLVAPPADRQVVFGKWFCQRPFLPFLFPPLFFFFSLPPLFSLFNHGSSTTKQLPQKNVQTVVCRLTCKLS
jgi:hypothetical protein